MKFSARLVILAALVLIVGAVQCASACTPVSSAQPPCHHHKQAPTNHCPQEMVAAGVAQAAVAAAPVFSCIVGTLDSSVHVAMESFGVAADPSPPFLHPPVPLNLRV